MRRFHIAFALVVRGFTSLALVCCAIPSQLQAQTPVSWIIGSGNWTTAGNWSGGVVPNNGVPTYNVFIDGTNGGTPYTITLNSGITVSNFTMSASQASLIQTSGSIFQTSSASISAGLYQVNGATIKGGTWTISGTGKLTFNLSSLNTLDGVNVTGSIDLSASSAYVQLKGGSDFGPGTVMTLGNSAVLGVGQSSTLNNLTLNLGSNSRLAIEGN